MKYNKVSYFFIFFSAVFGALMLYLSNYDTIWYDEAFSLSLISKPINDIVSLTAIDVHPPLYYIILKLVVSCFPNTPPIHIAKLVSIIPMIILLIISFLYARKKTNINIASILIFSIIAMPHLFQTGIEIRMYSYTLLFVSLGLFLAFEIIEKPNKLLWIGFSFIAILAIYTHYFAAIAFIVIYIIIFLVSSANRKKEALISGFIVSLFYLPWLHILLNQLQCVKKEYWISKITLKNIIGFFSYPFSLDLNLNSSSFIDILITLLITSITIYGYSLNKKKNYKKYSIILISCFIGVIIIGLLISWLYAPILYKRYLIPCLVGIWFAVAISLDALHKNNRLRNIWIIIFLIGILNVGNTFFTEIYAQKNMDYFTENICKNIKQNQKLIHSSEHSAGCMSQLGHHNNIIWCENLINENVILHVFDKIDNIVNLPIDRNYENSLHQPESCWYFIRQHEKKIWNNFFHESEYMGRYYIFDSYYYIYFVE